VHSGKSVGSQLLTSAKRISAAVTEWLFLLSSKSPREWRVLLKEIDVLAAFYEASGSPDVGLLHGLAVPTSSRIPKDLISKEL
jgi:hypothetical protein